MSWVQPAALLLLLPFLLLLWRVGAHPRLAMALRVVSALAVTLALARPLWRQGGDELDLVVVVDRSASMPARSDALGGEWIAAAEHQRKPGQRVGVVTFGRESRVEAAPSADREFAGFLRPVDADASDLAAALDAAGDLLRANKAGRILLISDGRATGGDSRAAARRLALRGIPVDFHLLERPQASWEVAVDDLEVPASVATDEPFQLAGIVTATRYGKVGYTLFRQDVPLSRGQADLVPGKNRLLFRDRLGAVGLARYRLELDGVNDATPENDRGLAVVRAEGPQRVLVMRPDASLGALGRSLAAAKVRVEVAVPPLASLGALEGVASVVLDEISAAQLGDTSMKLLDTWVRERGGGLVMTGGPESFGQGGYFKSPLDDLLPVSMEVRKEQRRSSLAMVIAMDRSGSMAIPAADGRPKMALAAEGAVAALQLLSTGDEAAVFVVDTQPHSILSLTRVEEGLPLDRVARVHSEGGGIYIDEALHACEREIEKSSLHARHVVLFADANDSEQPGDYRDVVLRLAHEEVTVSVIGMGTRDDKDAHLLEDIARLGHGRVYLADSPDSLPRVFSQETITLARSSYLDVPTALEATADLRSLGAPQAAWASPPRVGGYNLTYLRPGASAAFRTADDAHAPILALWQRGLGRVATFSAPVDGEAAADLLAWPGYQGLFAQVVRWTLPPPTPDDVLVTTRREGHELLVTAEVDPEAVPVGQATVTLLSGSGLAPAEQRPLDLDDDGRLTARFTLSGSGTFHPLVRWGALAVAAPPAALPYPPEYEVQASHAGRSLLTEVAQLSGGAERLSATGLFERSRLAPGGVELAPPLTALALVCLLLEVLVRRVRFQPRRLPNPIELEPVPSTHASLAPPSSNADVGDALRQVTVRARQRRKP